MALDLEPLRVVRARLDKVKARQRRVVAALYAINAEQTKNGSEIRRLEQEYDRRRDALIDALLEGNLNV